ncbi:DUF6323 family protein [Clostridium oryzae]|uniref:Uncharacterized protein n=1 Tax=Clostridium oryzae TaxID=1450648 RepID=A0A1V4ISU7_9CLOT|nr:DUF6323 family protein [Clostridium oryzae]OPJ62874.1 hypothetical protein CLORY_14980 [Clostridium oryzae]
MNLPNLFNARQGLLKNTYVEELIEASKESGLLLTIEDAKKIINERSNALKNYGRVDLNFEVTKKIIGTFDISSFANVENYVQILIELQDLFYYLRNETEDRISDQKILELMKDFFENSCEGSIQLLVSRIEEFSREFRSRLSSTDKIRIDLSTLGNRQYTISLLRKSVKLGILKGEAAIKIQRSIMDLLKEQIIRYTGGENSSVSEATAEGLLNSILYTIDFYLISIGNAERALLELKSNSISEIFKSGIELLNCCLRETKRLYEKVKKHRLNVDIEAYNSTIDEGIPIFFEKYNVIFGAQNTIVSVDYPLIFDDMQVKGIAYIKNYLKNLELENEFCRNYQDEEINKLLMNYGKMCKLNHRIEFINIFEVVINNAIFSNICSNKMGILSISEQQYTKLYIQLKGMETSLIKELIISSLEDLINNLNIHNTNLIRYLNNYLLFLECRIFNALEHNCLDSVIVVDHHKDKQYGVVFDEGKRMNTKEFKIMLDRILNCSNGAEKAEIIYSSVFSLQDYIDLLNGDCLFEDDYTYLFSKLGEIELTILVKIVFFEELRDGDRNISLLINKKSDKDIQWEKYFCEFLQMLDNNRIIRIEKLIDEVDYEELIF